MEGGCGKVSPMQGPSQKGGPDTQGCWSICGRRGAGTVPCWALTPSSALSEPSVRESAEFSRPRGQMQKWRAKLVKAQHLNSSRVQFQSQFLVPACHPPATVAPPVRPGGPPPPPVLVWKGGRVLLGPLSPPRPVPALLGPPSPPRPVSHGVIS